ncbi:hypothetical protein ACFSSA_05800 [Luteolibacter algae]|uniref:Anti-sigma factor n=1 Tax=Luteolibacter algae TaxID=454151 RepID=A0ABW5D743_9BACT
MDREKARFILRSFRPDGADANDADFAEALQLATSDRELGEWLVRERAFDVEFAESLARVELPAGLRADVLLAMVQSGSEYPRKNTDQDERMMDAMASISVPEGLRDRILVSMEKTEKVVKADFNWSRFGIPLAAVAGIVLALVLMIDRSDSQGSSNPGVIAENQTSAPTAEAVQASAISTIESPIFSLDEMNQNQRVLVSHLRARGLPCGELNLPESLLALKGLGCRELVIDGRKGSLICLDDKNGEIHLVIFRRSDVEGDLPTVDHPNIYQSGNWARASWANEKYAYSLIAMRSDDDLRAFF